MDPYKSARAILPFVMKDWVRTRGFQPTVVDVGCGDGSWLRVAKELKALTIGVDRGLQASSDVDVAFNEDLIVALHDSDAPHPFPGKCDLAICLEVAEHLPEDCGSKLVEFLCEAAPVVLFSAAQPGQGPYPPEDATDENRGCWHINEQPIAYWAELFKAWGYQQLDVIRPRFERDVRVDPWYRSNAALYVRGD